jgi:hypothetical protein
MLCGSPVALVAALKEALDELMGILTKEKLRLWTQIPYQCIQNVTSSSHKKNAAPSWSGVSQKASIR